MEGWDLSIELGTWSQIPAGFREEWMGQVSKHQGCSQGVEDDEEKRRSINRREGIRRKGEAF